MSANHHQPPIGVEVSAALLVEALRTTIDAGRQPMSPMVTWMVGESSVLTACICAPVGDNERMHRMWRAVGDCGRHLRATTTIVVQDAWIRETDAALVATLPAPRDDSSSLSAVMVFAMGAETICRQVCYRIGDDGKAEWDEPRDVNGTLSAGPMVTLGHQSDGHGSLRGLPRALQALAATSDRPVSLAPLDSAVRAVIERKAN